MTLPSWRPGTAVQGPVYLDANIWVSALVNSQPRYKSASRLLADLIAAGVPLVVSDIVASESHWALARLAYAELIHQRSDRVNWHRAAWHATSRQLFATKGARIGAFGSFVANLHKTGYPIFVTAPAAASLGSIAETVTYMQAFGLMPTDAAHLALAHAHASTFITEDRDFGVVPGPNQPSGLTLLGL